MLLVNKDTDTTSPVVVQVPPPKDDESTENEPEQPDIKPILPQAKQPLRVADKVELSSKKKILVSSVKIVINVPKRGGGEADFDYKFAFQYGYA